MKILMVCLGNICRSPLAHGLLQKKVDDRGLDWYVDSAGTGAYHVGEGPDPRSVDVAAAHDLDIRYQKARQFIVDDFEEYDLIFAMDSSNYSNMMQLARNEEDQQKIHLILNESYPGENRTVPDPYYGGDQGFKNVYDMLDEATNKLLERLVRAKNN